MIIIEDFEIKAFNFPAGEVGLRLLKTNPYKKDVIIQAKIENSNDIMTLLMATDALRRMGHKNISLDMPYVPYARQDRVCVHGEAHSLKVFADLINSQQYTNVTVFDPHSDVCEAVFNNLTIVKNHNFVRQAINMICTDATSKFCIVCPDAGAAKKIGELVKFLAPHYNTFDVVHCGKKRDPATGNLAGFTVEADSLDPSLEYIIVDDISSKGRTFLGLAMELKKKGASNFHLVVSHDEGVADKEEFKAAGFKSFYKTNSLSTRHDEFFKTLKAL